MIPAHPRELWAHADRCAYRKAGHGTALNVCDCGVYVQWLILGPKTLGPPEPARLPCPYCGIDHIDAGEWVTRPHHKHLCLHCGRLFRVEGQDGEYFYGVANPDHYP